MSCDSHIPLAAPAHYKFRDYELMKKRWYKERYLQPGKLQVVISTHVSTEGFWITLLNEPMADFDIIYRGNEIVEMFKVIDCDYEKTGKIERQFYISLPGISGGIKTIGGIIIDCPPVFDWMYKKTLKHIKPWILKQDGYRVEECDI